MKPFKIHKEIMLFVAFATICLSEALAQNAPGSDRDGHGCIASAGYLWSKVKKECVRLFEVAQAYEEINPTDKTYTASCYIIFSKGGNEAEVFLPTRSEGIVCAKSKTGFDNKKENIIIKREKDRFFIYVNGNKTYSPSKK